MSVKSVAIYMLVSGSLLSTLASPLMAQSLIFLGDNNIDYPSLRYASGFAKMAEHVYFSAQANLGTELYRVNPTTDIVELVKDIAPGRAGSNPRNFTPLGSSLYFTAGSNPQNQILWKSDGTSQGTTAVTETTGPLVYGFAGRQLLALNDKLIFLADNKLYTTTEATTGAELLQYDSSAYPSAGLTRLGQVAYFVGSDNASGQELWKTDGSYAGTAMVKNISAGSAHSQFRQWMDLNGTLYFSVNDGSGTYRLWKSDGTEPGTIPVSGEAVTDVKNLEKDTAGLYFTGTTPAGARLFFTDGQSSPTEIATLTSGGSYAGALRTLGDTLYFSRDVGDSTQLWKTDGTIAGTTVVDEEPIWLPTTLSSVAGDFAYFAHSTTAHGQELWRTDGTLSGTELLVDLEPGPKSSHVAITHPVGEDVYFRGLGNSGWNVYRYTSSLDTVTTLNITAAASPASLDIISASVDLNGKIYYSAMDGQHGIEPWVSDGTPEGTHLLLDVVPGPGSSDPANFTRISNTVYFSITTGNYASELWRTDGTPAGTMRVKAISEDFLVHFYAVDDILYFFEKEFPPKYHLWRSDGTADGTFALNTPQNFSIATPVYAAAGNSLMFVGNDFTGNGYELWRADNDSASIEFVKDLLPGSTSSILYEQFPATIADEAYFFAENGGGTVALWKTNGTSDGTVKLREMSGPLSLAFQLSAPRATNRHFDLPHYFYADGTWVTDGTPEGTIKLADADAPIEQTTVNQFVKINGRVIFAGTNSGFNSELWSSDGTITGTARLLEIKAGLDGSSPGLFTRFGDAVYFRADDGIRGAELWKTDGTSAGTVLVKDLNPGPASSFVSEINVAGSTLVFSAEDGTHGRRIWRSRGDSASTVPIEGLEAWPLPTSLSDLRIVQGTAIVHAYNELTGADLWAIQANPGASAANDWQLFE